MDTRRWSRRSQGRRLVAAVSDQVVERIRVHRVYDGPVHRAGHHGGPQPVCRSVRRVRRRPSSCRVRLRGSRRPPGRDQSRRSLEQPEVVPVSVSRRRPWIASVGIVELAVRGPRTPGGKSSGLEPSRRPALTVHFSGLEYDLEPALISGLHRHYRLRSEHLTDCGPWSKAG